MQANIGAVGTMKTNLPKEKHVLRTRSRARLPIVVVVTSLALICFLGVARCAERPGGYLRIVKLPKLRKGDNAPLSIVEFVDYDEVEASDDGEVEGSKKKGGLLGKILGGRKKKAPVDDE